MPKSLFCLLFSLTWGMVWSWVMLPSSGRLQTTRASPSPNPSSRFLPTTSMSQDMDEWDIGPESYTDVSSEGGVGEENEAVLSDEELEAYLGDWDERVAQLNTVHLVGRIGNVPEARYFDDGKVVVNLSLASQRKYHYAERKERNVKYGEEETDWYGLEIWGSTAEFVSKYVEKGARVGVIGSLQIDEWNDKATGEKRSRAKVIVREFDILETKAEAELRRSNRRGPSFYTGDNDDDDDMYRPNSGGGGGFFD